MSLLMDALKKAEQEKKEASKQTEESDNRETTDRLKLEEKSDKDDVKPEPDSNTSIQPQDVLPQDTTGDQENSSITEGLTLEPITSGSTQMESLPDTSGLDEETQSGEPESRDLVDLTLTSELKTNDQENTHVATESDKAVNSSKQIDSNVDDIPDEFLESGNRSTRRARALISAKELINDLGGGRDQPTPVAAQTVFEAKGIESSSQNVKWAIFILLCLVITGSFSVLYYFSIVPTDYDIKSPMVTRSIETGNTELIEDQTPEDISITKIQPEDQPALIEEPEWKKLDEMNGFEFTGNGGTYSPGVKTPVEIQDAHTATLTNQDSVPVKEEIAGSVYDQQTTVNEENIIDTPSESDIQSRLDETTVVEIPSNEIRISKSKSIDSESTTINKAYQAFRRGDLALAENAYMQVLTKFPENRDALLGIAAVAQRKGNNNSAYKFYLEVLKLYPNDVAAQSALVGLNRNIDPVRGESTIKTLLQKQPQAAYLYFILGNLYAGRENWPKAQQAFFDAHRIDSTNPDYALNLAVSLDHMGLPEAALDYYNKVLTLSSDVPVSFDTASVVTRIDTITQTIQTSN